MRCRLLRDENRPVQTDAEYQSFVTTGRLPVLPAGTIIDHPDAHVLVRMGMAEPADVECAVAARLTLEQMTAAQWAQERVRRGIHPEDYEAFDAGKMIGYDAAGNWIPGPNYVPGDDEVETDHGESEQAAEDYSGQIASIAANQANAVNSSPAETVAPVASQTPPVGEMATDTIDAADATAAATAAPVPPDAAPPQP